MKNVNNMMLKLLAETVLINAKKEANSACMCLGYQPKMPEKVKELITKK